jgi:hypothetical protein
MEFQREVLLMCTNSIMYNDPDTDIAAMAHEIRAYAESEIRALRYYGAGEMEARRASIVSSMGVGSERDEEFEWNDGNQNDVESDTKMDSDVDSSVGERAAVPAARGRPKGSKNKAILAKTIVEVKKKRK